LQYTCNPRKTIVFASMHLAKLLTSREDAGGHAPTILKDITERTSRSPLHIDMGIEKDINKKKTSENEHQPYTTVAKRAKHAAISAALGIAHTVSLPLQQQLLVRLAQGLPREGRGSEIDIHSIISVD
jgi:hypothetical protein